MYIKELKSSVVKKNLEAESARYRWHNKNKSGGNFGINIIGVNGKDYEISGYYNVDGLLRGLRFGNIFCAGCPMDVNSLEQMFEFIHNAIGKRV